MASGRESICGRGPFLLTTVSRYENGFMKYFCGASTNADFLTRKMMFSSKGGDGMIAFPLLTGSGGPASTSSSSNPLSSGSSLPDDRGSVTVTVQVTETATGSNSSTNAGVIAGSVVGGAVFGALVTVLVMLAIWFFRSRRESKAQRASGGGGEYQAHGGGEYQAQSPGPSELTAQQQFLPPVWIVPGAVPKNDPPQSQFMGVEAPTTTIYHEADGEPQRRY